MKAFISFELYVRRVEHTADFFQSVFGGSVEYSDGDFAVIWLGDSRIILNRLNLKEFSSPNPVLAEGAMHHLGSGLEVAVSVDDIEEAHSRVVQEKAKEVTPIVQQSWGLKDFRFLLEDGYYIRVTEADEGVKKIW